MLVLYMLNVYDGDSNYQLDSYKIVVHFIYICMCIFVSGVYKYCK